MALEARGSLYIFIWVLFVGEAVELLWAVHTGLFRELTFRRPFVIASALDAGT
jgi:hypothetical protein